LDKAAGYPKIKLNRGENEMNEIRIFRSFAIPVKTFDYFKRFQRKLKAIQGEDLNNNQVLVVILKQHEQYTEESE
jgi:hypothetical protein